MRRRTTSFFLDKVYPSSFKNLLVKSRKRKNGNFLKKTSFFLSKTIEFNWKNNNTTFPSVVVLPNLGQPSQKGKSVQQR